MSKVIDLSKYQIETRIFTIRSFHVILDYHLAELYNVETKRVNEQVKRNINRFPDTFMFQLSKSEWQILKSQIEINEKEYGLQSQIATTKRRSLPYVFTEQGVAMLSAVLKSDTAVNISIQIMNAFVKMRHLFLENSLIQYRLDKVENAIIETDQKFEKVFRALENKDELTKQGVFFNGQVFDAYSLASKIIRSAKNSIVLIDNYIDESTLTHLTKKNKSVKVFLLSKNINKKLKLDAQKANEQYKNFELKIPSSHGMPSKQLHINHEHKLM